jgi:hypothetical protein
VVGPLLAAALLSAGAGGPGVLIALLPMAFLAGAATLGLLAQPVLTE